MSIFLQNCQTRVDYSGGFFASLRRIERRSVIEGTIKPRWGYRCAVYCQGIPVSGKHVVRAGTFISFCRGVIANRKIPYKCWSRGEHARHFFFECSLHLYPRKNIYSSIVYVWWVHVWGVKYYDGVRPVSLLSTPEMILIFIYSEFDGDIGK